MALLPHIIGELFDTPSNHHYFGVGFHPQDLWVSPLEPYRQRSLVSPGLRRYQPSMNWLNIQDGAEKKSHIGKDGFQVCLDVQHFQPNEISVKTVGNSVVVEAKHEEREDNHGHISRQFSRRYNLPSGFKAEDVVSSISSDGVLTIKAPPVTPTIEGENVRHVQIQQTGPARLNITNKDEKLEKQEAGNNGQPKK